MTDLYRSRAQVLVSNYGERLSLSDRVRLAQIAMNPQENDAAFLATFDHLLEDSPEHNEPLSIQPTRPVPRTAAEWLRRASTEEEE